MTNLVRLQGVVTAALSDKTYFLQDGDAGVYVFHRPAEALNVGDWVETTGKPSIGNLKPLLDGTAVRRLGRRELPEPIVVTLDQAMSGGPHMRLIRIRGRLAEERPRGTKHLVLNAGGSTNSFLADLDAVEDYESLDRLEPGSLLELTGACFLRAPATGMRPTSMTVFVRTAADVVVVSGPPWWTLERTLAVLGISMGSLGLALLWGTTLRRQVRRQTADLRTRLEKETLLELRYRQLFETNPQPLLVYDAQTRKFVAVNEAATHQYGYSKEEFLGLTIYDIRPPEDLPQFEKRIAEVKSGLSTFGVWRHKKKNGQIIEVEVSSHESEFNGRPAKVVLALDVTARQQAEAALRKSEQYRRAIIEAEPECVKVIAANGALLDMNAAGLAMLEASSLDDVKQHGVMNFVLPAYREAFSELHRRVMSGGSGVLEFEVEGLKGTRRWLETHAVLLTGTDGSDPALLGITRDITERKHAQAELQRTKERFATIFRTNPDSIAIVSVADERIVEVNPAFERLMGHTAAEAIGKTTAELNLWVDPADRARLIALIKSRRSVVNGEARLRSKSGRIIDILSSAEVIEYAGQTCIMSLSRDITDRKAAEDKLRRSEASLAAAQQIASLGSWELELFNLEDMDRNPLTWSDEVFRIFGHQPGSIEVTHENFFEAVHPEDRQRVQDAVSQALQNRESYRIEHRIVRPDGTERTVQEYSEIIVDPANGRPLRMLGVVQDVTERTVAERALRESRQRYAELVRTIEGIVWEADAKTFRFTFVSEQAERLLGYPTRQWSEPDFWQDHIHPDDRTGVTESCRTTTQQGLNHDFEYRMMAADGREVWLRDIVTVVVEEGKAPVLRGVMVDVTGRKEAEFARERAFATLELFIDSMPGYVSFVDANLRYQLVNPGYESWFGLKKSEIVGRNLDELHPPSVYAEMRPMMERALAGETLHYERRVDDASGQYHWFDIRYIPRTGADKTVTGFFALVFDITPQKEAELALRENRERLDSILSSLDDVVWSSTVDGSKALFLNKAVEVVFGRPAAQFFADSHLWLSMIHPDDQATANAAFEGLMAGAAFESRYRIIRPDGSVRWLRDRGCVVRDAEGRSVRLDGIATDITTQMEAEEKIRNINSELELRVTQRTAELATANKELESFSYSVSHDLRAPLRAIEGFGNILQQECAPQLEDKGLRYLDRVRVGTRRMGDLIDGLLKLSRFTRAPMTRIEVDMTQLVLASLAELQSGDPERQVEAVIAPGVTASGDSSLLRAAVQNLVENAWKYSSRRTQSRIEFGVLDRDDERVFFIRDDGAGFDMAYAGKLFGAFQRLHGIDEFDGTGIGLATVQRIVHRHGGRIWAEAEVDNGATFSFTLSAKPATPDLKL